MQKTFTGMRACLATSAQQSRRRAWAPQITITACKCLRQNTHEALHCSNTSPALKYCCKNNEETTGCSCGKWRLQMKQTKAGVLEPA